MDKKVLMKNDNDNTMKQHIDTYEYISNTFKNMHD